MPYPLITQVKGGSDPYPQPSQCLPLHQEGLIAITSVSLSISSSYRYIELHKCLCRYFACPTLLQTSGSPHHSTQCLHMSPLCTWLWNRKHKKFCISTTLFSSNSANFQQWLPLNLCFLGILASAHNTFPSNICETTIAIFPTPMPHLLLLIPLQSFHDVRKTPGGERAQHIHQEEI